MDVEISTNTCYNPLGAAGKRQAVGPVHPGGGLLAPSKRGGDAMQITYSELFQFCLVIIGIIGLFLQAKKK